MVSVVAATAEMEQEQEGEREREDEQRVVGAAEATAAGVEVVRRGLGVRLGLLVVRLWVLDNHGLETRSSWHRGRAQQQGRRPRQLAGSRLPAPPRRRGRPSLAAAAPRPRRLRPSPQSLADLP